MLGPFRSMVLASIIVISCKQLTVAVIRWHGVMPYDDYFPKISKNQILIFVFYSYQQNIVNSTGNVRQ